MYYYYYYSSSPAIHFLFALFLFHLYFTPCYQQVCNQQDQSALLPFFTNISTSSSSSLPLQWSSDVSCCNWEGVHCASNGSVTRLQLPSRGLRGVITPSLGNLLSLTHLDLSTNFLHGSLPYDLFEHMESLESIDISNNKFQGFIEPTWFSKALIRFNCSNNTFVGHIPSSICSSSPSLQAFDLSHNHLSGPILSEIGECSQLKVVRLGFNSISGPLPFGIFTLRGLTELSMPSNDLQGPIGKEIFGLTNLRIMDLSSNYLFSLIPQEIGQLLNMEKLYLEDNQLHGPIPHGLMNCTNLTDISLRDNYLKGDISTLDFSRLAHLQKLDLRNNSLYGTLPDSIYSCKSLVAFRAFHNNLTGQLSPKIVQLKSLSFFSLTLNSFTNITRTLAILANCNNLTSLFLGWNFYGESLPSDRNFISSTGFPKLEYFSIDSCNLTGSFPEWVAHLKTLRVFFLDRNKITGKIPTWVGTLPNLFSLSLSHNLFYGEIPHELCQLPALLSKSVDPKLNHFEFQLPIFVPRLSGGYNQYTTIPAMLNLSYNDFSGLIPSDLGRLQSLQQLDLRSNHFSGDIPASISSLVNLEVLDLSQNNLTGSLPAALKGLHFLSNLNVSYNELEGPVPTGGQFATFSQSSFEGNPGLCGELLGRSCSETARPEVDVSDGRKSFMDGFLVGCASGFSGVVAAVVSYCVIWSNYCKRNRCIAFFNKWKPLFNQSG